MNRIIFGRVIEGDMSEDNITFFENIMINGSQADSEQFSISLARVCYLISCAVHDKYARMRKNGKFSIKECIIAAKRQAIIWNMREDVSKYAKVSPSAMKKAIAVINNQYAAINKCDQTLIEAIIYRDRGCYIEELLLQEISRQKS